MGEREREVYLGFGVRSDDTPVGVVSANLSAAAAGLLWASTDSSLSPSEEEAIGERIFIF